MRLAAIFLAFLLPLAANAQVVPDLELDNPRFQRVAFVDGQQTLLTVVPGMGLTLLLEDGELVERVRLTDPTAFDVRVSSEGGTLLIVSERDEAEAVMQVETAARRYDFLVRTGTGLTAAYFVEFTYGDPPPAPVMTEAEPLVTEPVQRWSWRLRGDSVVQPLELYDDGTRTYIAYADDQALPAVFAIGQTGEEEMVNGHMRGELFVIDRVYRELVFRLDDERARAERNSRPDDQQ